MYVETWELKLLPRRERRNIIAAMLVLGKQKERAAKRTRTAQLRGVASQVLTKKDRKAVGL